MNQVTTPSRTNGDEVSQAQSHCQDATQPSGEPERSNTCGATVTFHSLVAVAMLLALYVMAYIYPVVYVYFVTEDQWSEYGTAVSWLIAAAVMSYGIVRTPALRKPGMYLFALGAAFIGMEEISWGQRMIGVHTPEIWKSINRQGEMTFHNIIPNSSYEFIFGTIVFIFGIAIPIAAIRSKSINKLLLKFGFPLARPHLWPMFVLVVYLSDLERLGHALPMHVEPKELALGIAMMMLGIDLVWTDRGYSIPLQPIRNQLAALTAVAIIAIGLIFVFPSTRSLPYRFNYCASIAYPRYGLYEQAAELYAYINANEMLRKPDSQLFHAAMLLKMDRADKANALLRQCIERLTQAQKEYPDNETNFMIAGHAFAILGEPQAAKDAYQAACSIEAAKLALETKNSKIAERLANLTICCLLSDDQTAANEYNDQFEKLSLSAADRHDAAFNLRNTKRSLKQIGIKVK